MLFKLIVTSFIVHIVFLYSIFDIYFRSPILSSLEQIDNDIETPAKRLALFIADGLRADYFFNYSHSKSHVPFLRDIVERKGSWGVSHTRVPTESRPGHVAIIAGIYEDPSAVFKGWKENPTDFDSVFNQSRATFGWGSPDILNIFSKGDHHNKIFNDMYPESMQDLSGTNGTAESLNYWVSDRFEQFLSRVDENADLKKKLNEDGIILFFHFLGTDVAGHASKPASDQYKSAMKSADVCTQRIVEMIEKFYGDDRTAFIFTSDHGMTDWGSHGDGSMAETETPLVAWGAGVSGPQVIFYQPPMSPNYWQLSSLVRRDIEQADLAPLMSIILGIPIPVNSVGNLPAEYLSMRGKPVSKALRLNALQLKKQFLVHESQVKDKIHSAFFTPYGLNEHTGVPMDEIYFRNLETMEHNHDVTLRVGLRLLKFYNDGIVYYKNYYSNILKALVCLSYLVWILYMMSAFFRLIQLNFQDNDTGDVETVEQFLVVVIFRCVFILASLTLLAQKMDFSFFVYTYLILYCTRHFIGNILILRDSDAVEDFEGLRRNGVDLFFSLIGYIIAIELIVNGFFNRGLLSVLMVLLAIWPFMCHSPELDNCYITKRWFFNCICLAVFPLLPVIGNGREINYVVLSGIVCSCLALFKVISDLILEHYESVVIGIILIFSNIGAVRNIIMIDESFSLDNGLPAFNQCFSWFLLVFSLLMVKLGSETSNNFDNFLYVCGFLNIPFILLSSGHESLFPLNLSLVILAWVVIELKLHHIYELPNFIPDEIISGSTVQKLIRFSLFYLIFIIISFFGIGNISSINSFDPTWTKNFVTTFSPFVMMTLILFKSIIPMLIVTSGLRLLVQECQVPVSLIFILIIIFSDVIGLHFFFNVTNKGSWLTIGTSISHYVIVECITLIIILLYNLVGLLMIKNALPKIKGCFWRILVNRLRANRLRGHSD